MNVGKKELRFAVIGLGKMGLLHSSLLSVLPNVKLAALCDKNRTLLRLGRKLFKEIELVDDIELLEDKNLDGVYITTPIPSHCAIASAVYAKGISQNIFVEKTLAANYRDAERLCKTAESRGVNMVGYMKRFSVTFVKAKSILDQRLIGGIEAFDAYAYSSDFLESQSGSQVSTSRGGVLNDLGSHIIDLGLWFFGDMEVESGSVDSRKTGSEGSTDFNVITSDKIRGRFDVSWCKDGYRMPEFGMRIHGNNGFIDVNDYKLTYRVSGKNEVSLYRHDLNDYVGYLLGESEYFREDQHFVDSILGCGRAEPRFATASKVDLLIDQVKVGGH